MATGTIALPPLTVTTPDCTGDSAITRLIDDRFERTGREIRISVDDREVTAIEGETIAAALAADGQVEYGHARDGSPRGPFCGMGVCHECIVTVDGGPASRACLTKAHAGMQIRTLDYRARVPESRATVAPYSNTEPLDCDVLVVGAGPAGLSAAEHLAQAGLHAVVVDERPEAGGQYFKPLAPSHAFATSRPVDSQYEQGLALIDRVNASGVELHGGTAVWSASQERDGAIDVEVIADTRAWTIRPRRLVLATGAHEQAVPFPGWTLPGVITTGAAQGLARAYRVGPGKRLLIAGNGPLNLQLAAELAAGGVEVVAVAESAPRAWPGRVNAALRACLTSPALMWRGLQYLRTLRRAGVALLQGHVVVRAEGEARVDTAVVAAIDARGRPRPDSERAFEVDALCIGYGFLPSNALARLIGCEHTSPAPGVLVPVRDIDGRTTVPGVYVVGDGGQLGGAHVAMGEGRLTAQAVLRELGRSTADDSGLRRKVARHRRFQRSLWSLFDAPAPGVALADSSTPLCRCEAVQRGTLEALVRDGITDLGSLKRLTRAGMGRCQGRYCTSLLAALVAAHSGSPPDPRSLFMPQRPLLPVPAGAVAAEQPEWDGYRKVSLPSRSRTQQSSVTRHETDVLVIGGGIIGICTAYFAAMKGLDVCVVERDSVNAQASGGNAGTLHLQLLSFEFRNPAQRGDAPAVLAVPLHREGISLWESLERDLQADFELGISGGIMVAETERELELLQAKIAAEKRQGVAGELLTREALRKQVPGISDRMIGGALCPGEGKINPLIATRTLLGAALSAGARVLQNTSVTSIRRDGDGFVVSTPIAAIHCGRIVNAAGAWTPEIARLAGIELPVHSAPQQMIVTEPVAPMVTQVLAHAGRHLTMKQAANGNLIIGGGWYADHDDELMRPITEHDSIRGNLWAACAVLPAVAGLNVIRSWAALGVAIDGAPIIGEAPGHPSIIHAVGANGYTLGPIIGRAVAGQLATGQVAPEAAPFSLARFA